MENKKSEAKIKIETLGKDKKNSKKKWETPTLEDVSERVMAQPYIRFT